MAKDRQFTAYDLDRRNRHKLPSPPVMINRHRIVKSEWEDAVAKKRGIRRTRNREVRLPSVAQILRAHPNAVCLQCGQETNECAGIKCYRQFIKDNFPVDPAELRGPGSLGYCVYTKPNVQIKEGQWVGEYIGELRPHEPEPDSMYKFMIPGKCALDSKEAGNWTRYINSHCKPNLDCVPEAVGRRHVILFKALRDIGPGEELTFNYGEEDYLKPAGLACKCSSCERTNKRRKVRKILKAL